MSDANTLPKRVDSTTPATTTGDVTVKDEPIDTNEQMHNVSHRARSSNASSSIPANLIQDIMDNVKAQFLDQLNDLRQQNQDLLNRFAQLQNQNLGQQQLNQQQLVPVPNLESTTAPATIKLVPPPVAPTATATPNSQQTNQMRATPSKPEKFDGVGDLSAREFLNQLYLYFANVQLSDNAKATLAASYMSGEALSWATARLKKLEAAGKMDSWTQFEDDFRELYCPTTADQLARTQLAQLRQGKSTVAQYYQTFARLLTEIVGMDDNSQKFAFINGLRKSLSTHLMVNPVKNLQEAVKAAARIEENIKINLSGHSSSSFFALDGEEVAQPESAKIKQLETKMSELQSNNQQLMAFVREANNNKRYNINNNNNNGKTCNHCGKKKHTAEECWKLHPDLKPEWAKKNQNTATIAKK